MANEIWNIPKKDFENRYKAFTNALEDIMGDKPLDILEIGVFRADLIRYSFDSKLNISSYDGIDPFLGDPTDPYRGGYWEDESAADGFYQKAQAIFDTAGQKLYRTTSVDFLNTIPENKKYDVIFVDGNHKYDFALQDMSNYFGRVRDGGVMIIDDYANVDHPDVTRAINKFIDLNRSNIKRFGYRTLEFQNRGKEIPVVLTFVYIEPIPDSERT